MIYVTQARPKGFYGSGGGLASYSERAERSTRSESIKLAKAWAASGQYEASATGLDKEIARWILDRCSLCYGRGYRARHRGPRGRIEIRNCAGCSGSGERMRREH